MRATTYRVLGSAERYSDAAEQLQAPGDCVVVERSGTQRQLVLRCPDGCGETLSINLDRRSGPAWRLYKRRNRYSLFPSIDKPDGCQSHFILSNGKIIWCDWWSWDEDLIDEDLLFRVRDALSDKEMTSFVTVADKLDAVPWDVLTACLILKRRGLAHEGSDKLRGNFWLVDGSSERSR